MNRVYLNRLQNSCFLILLCSYMVLVHDSTATWLSYYSTSTDTATVQTQQSIPVFVEYFYHGMWALHNDPDVGFALMTITEKLPISISQSSCVCVIVEGFCRTITAQVLIRQLWSFQPSGSIIFTASRDLCVLSKLSNVLFIYLFIYLFVHLFIPRTLSHFYYVER